MLVSYDLFSDFKVKQIRHYKFPLVLFKKTVHFPVVFTIWNHDLDFPLYLYTNMYTAKFSCMSSYYFKNSHLILTVKGKNCAFTFLVFFFFFLFF